MPDLKRFQRDAVEEAVALLSRDRGPMVATGGPTGAAGRPRAVLLEAPTGSGKTRMAGTIAARLCAIDQVVWFWFAPFTGVVDQACDTLRWSFPGLRVRDIRNDRSAEDFRPGDIYPITWQTVAVRNEVTRLVNRRDEERFALAELIRQARLRGERIGIVVDEAHHGLRAGGAAAGFIRDVLRPDHILLVTATPDDADVEAFRRICGLPRISRIAIGRRDAVDAGLVKRDVRVVAFAPPAEGPASWAELARTAIRFGVETHRAIAAALAADGRPVTPLLLVQVDSAPGSVEAARAILHEFGVDPASIAVHTAAEPDPDLLAIAADEHIEVLIFKMAVALGFDAPRAWTLVSMRRSRNVDFGVQLLGRVMRVDGRLFGVNLPPGLDGAYAFVADPDVQDGIVSAADRINALAADIRRVAPDARLTLVQLADPAACGSVPSGSAAAAESRVMIAGGLGRADAPAAETAVVPLSGGSAADLFGIGRPRTRSAHAQAPIASRDVEHALRRDLEFPPALLRERFPIAENAVTACVAQAVDFGPAALQALSPVGASTGPRTAEAFLRSLDRPGGNGALADFAGNLLADGQAALFENDHVNGRTLLPALTDRLAIECRRAGMDEWLASAARLEEGVYRILGSAPSLLRQAVRRCLVRHVEVAPAEPLPESLWAPSEAPRSRLNIYGIMPLRLSDGESAFAVMLDEDVSGTVLWWHRNESRKPESVSICAPEKRHDHYPGFVVGVRGRKSQDGVLLVNVEHRAMGEDFMVEARAEHARYGGVMTLARTESGRWRIVERGRDGERVARNSLFSVKRMVGYR